MQKVVSLFLLISFVAVVRGDWSYYVTYSDDNCTIPVVAQLTSGLFCIKRSSESAQLVSDCNPIAGSNSTYINSILCGDVPPTINETESLSTVITLYPMSNNCSIKDYTQTIYLTDNYVGVMYGFLPPGIQQTGAININATCSGEGVLSTSFCYGSLCFSSSIDDQCLYDSNVEASATQTGCAVLPPSAVPETQVDVPSTQPIHAPTTSNASIVSTAIGILSLFNVLF